MSENYSFKWNGFLVNVAKSFRKLREEGDFCDVTLVSNDQRQFSAHKVVLSACSEYFKNILKVNKHPSPLLCLDGISSSDINNVLDYAYHGEVDICQNDLDRFLGIAGRFQLEGLITDENNCQPIDFKFDVKEMEDQIKEEDIETEDMLSNTTSDNTKIIVNLEEFDFSNKEELDTKLIEYIEKDGKKWKCKICKKISRNKSHAKEHVEVHCKGLSYPCPHAGCDRKLGSSGGLRAHIFKYHKI